MGSSFHVINKIRRVSKEFVAAAGKYPAATLCEANGGKGALSHTIKPIRTKMKLCGTAVPVAARPGDNLIVHKAMYVAQPGDVLLVSTGSFLEAGIWGVIMAEAARQRGIQGLVTDGAVRDTDEIEKIGFPVFCKGVSIKGTTKSCAGTINHPICLEGVDICPGDLIVGNCDGVVVVAFEDVPAVLEAAQKREEKENRIISEIRQGRTTLELYGFSELLERAGVKEE